MGVVIVYYILRMLRNDAWTVAERIVLHVVRWSAPSYCSLTSFLARPQSWVFNGSRERSAIWPITGPSEIETVSVFMWVFSCEGRCYEIRTCPSNAFMTLFSNFTIKN